MTLSIAIAGAAGRMGQTLVRAASDDARFQIVGVTERPGASALGVDVGILSGLPASGISAVEEVHAAAASADVWLDFTAPSATLLALEGLRETRVRAAIVGTTGLSPEQEDQVAEAAKRIAIVRSGNFSLGVNLLAALVRQAARRLGPDWDIEISETHHRRKIDAPSGTAFMFGEAAAEGRDVSLATTRLPPYDRATAARAIGGIGFSVRRGGGVVGDHEVSFLAERECITLSHRALDRALFADGALAAALWADNKPAGLYSMSDVLGL
ncbi:MAG: 4-hydroxy-tetrahydrodipicolinate reductase [Terricaulis sp.]